MTLLDAFDRIGSRITHKEFRSFKRNVAKYFYIKRRNKRKKGNKHRNSKTK